MRNYVINGGFDVFRRTDKDLPILKGQAVNGAGDWTAERWWAGPGFGGSLDWSILDFDGPHTIPGTPRHFLRLQWTVGPTKGEKPGSDRFTCLENHGLRDARQLHGCWVDVTWWLRLASGTIAVIPVVWANYVNSDFAIFSGEAFPIRDYRGWIPMTQTIWIPPVPTGKAIDETSYVGFGLDFLGLYGPTLDVACVSAVRKTVDLRDPQLERILATGVFR